MKKDIRVRFKKMVEVPMIDDFVDFPGMLVWQLQHLWQRQLNSKLENYKLTHMQFIMLSALEIYLSTGQEATQANFAKAVKFDIMMTSNVLRKLEERQLVTRVRNPNDTRSVLLDITLEGRNLVKKSRKVVDEFNNNFFSVLGEQLSSFSKNMIDLINANSDVKINQH